MGLKVDFNYTQIPNELIDYWMRRISPAAFKVLMCVCMKTFALCESNNFISKEQICKATNISKKAVQSALEELEGHKLIVKCQNEDECDSGPDSYTLNIKKPVDTLYQ